MTENGRGTAVRYRIAVGPLAGRKTMVLRNPNAMADEPTLHKPFTAARDGFSINAAVACQANQRSRLEHVCCYTSRVPAQLGGPCAASAKPSPSRAFEPRERRLTAHTGMTAMGPGRVKSRVCAVRR